ncbi:MAG: hypothetical protein LBF40_01600 [Deltaproteobacteria bacterium]|jgi:uncharacterized protein YcfJ|nr:hypothetical protein [Deltaproteobacteria bacterium]
MRNTAILDDAQAKPRGKAVPVRITLAILLLAFFATGCGAGLGKQTVVIKHYAKCYEPITILRQEAKELSSRVAQGAVGGALAGAVGGLLSGGSTQDILLGAAGGAIAGATASYIVTTELQAQDQATRFAAYSKYLDEDYRTLDKAVASARVTVNCYKEAYRNVERDYKAGRMSREEMVERVQEIRDGSADAKEILQYYSDASAANMKAFDLVQQDEVKRTADRASSSRMRNYTQQVSKNKKVVNEATQLDQELDVLIVNADNLIKVVFLRDRRMIEQALATFGDRHGKS